MNNIKTSKKILFVATVDSHIINFHIPYLRLLKEQGYEVHVCTGEKGKIDFCDKKYNISITRSPYKIGNITAIKQLKTIIKENNYVMIHCHTPMGSVVTRLAAKSARKNGTRVIYTAHGFHFYKGAPLVNWMIYYPIEKWMSKYTDCLITINKEDYDLAKKKFYAGNTELINGIGIDEKKFSNKITDKEKHNIRKSLNISDEDFVIIYVARMDKNKNHIMIINAMEKLLKKNSNIKLLIVGSDELNEYNQKVVKEKNIKNVTFLGYRKDVEKLIQCSNIGISTSKREGLGLNLIEEIYSGLPVVALDNRGHREIIQDNVNGYLFYNEEDMIEKIIKLTDKKKYKEILEKSKETVEKFLLKNVRNEMEKIYGTTSE